MDRRKSIKSIILGGVAGGLALHGCKPDDVQVTNQEVIASTEGFFGRTPEELEQIKKLKEEQFFNPHEMDTITVLANLILPPDDKGNISDAEVPELIEFMSKDIPALQATLRGGLMWLDHECNSLFDTEFKAATDVQQKQILDTIAYPDPEVPGYKLPLQVQFFSLMRNLTLTGYYTSKVGIADLGYKGNSPNVWDGVPEEVLQQHGVAYEPEWLAKCVDQSKRNDTAEWDDNGKLLT
tara:strand:- start:54134 stop:54847 length:714 start_codon:yes stop_codon:yes gene_type:complete